MASILTITKGSSPEGSYRKDCAVAWVITEAAGHWFYVAHQKHGGDMKAAELEALERAEQYVANMPANTVLSRPPAAPQERDKPSGSA